MSTAQTFKTSKFSIGPGNLSTPGTPGGRPFLLSNAEWFNIQTFVTNAFSLPTTETAFKTSLGSGAPTDMSSFRPLINCYQNINNHCTTWQNSTFPFTVDLASDIVNYANKCEIYYNAILTEANILTNDPDNRNAQATLKAILDNLSKQATGYQNRAIDAERRVTEFANQTKADQAMLIGTDGKGGLINEFNDKFGNTSAEVKTLCDEITAQRMVLDGANAEYNRDVIVATTTPTYAWVFPIGTIAASVVAGVYGDKAVKALETARNAQQRINELDNKVAADANLMVALNSAQSSMFNLINSLTTALPVIQIIQGVWGSIANDLINLNKIIDTDIRQALPIITNLGVTEAINAWKQLGTEANDYRVHAYITVQFSSKTTSFVKAN